MSALATDLPPAYAAHAAHVMEAIRAGRKPTQAPPFKYATPRNPANPTMGPAVARASIALGEPLMPWQRQVVDVACELDPDRPGTWRYQTVIVTVSRQSGKTTLMRAVRISRALMAAHRVILMTAQTGKDARKQWAKLADRATRVGSPLAPFAQVRQSQGSEALTLPNGSAISPFAPTPKSVHGDTTHLWDVDECWAFGAEDGGALIDALDPTQITVPDRQAWLFTTQGTAASTWWNEYDDMGMAAVLDPASRVAYFNCSAPEDADPYSPLTVASFHPAVGHTQRLDDLMEKASGPAAVWRRAYLNLRPSTDGTSAANGLDLGLWAELGKAGKQARPHGSQVVVAYAVAEDRSGASIWAAWPAAEGKTHLQLVATDAGAAWLPPALAELQRTLQPRRILANDGGLTRNSTTEAERLGVQVERVGTRDYAEASMGLVSAVADGNLTHDATPELTKAIEIAPLRPMAGSRGFDARAAEGPIDHLQAAVVALWAAQDDTPVIQLF